MMPRDCPRSTACSLNFSPGTLIVAMALLQSLHPALGPMARAENNTPAQKSDPASQWPQDPTHQQLLAAADRSVAQVAARVARDRFRPAFHFAPAGRFMNDPDGCVQFDGAYHVFYQHLPYWPDPKASASAWGHAVTRDLVHWHHWPIALMPVPNTYDAAAVASGSCVIADGLPTIVYTSVPPQAQSLARSFDGMRTWRRFAGNPVVPKPPAIPGLEDGFRDPFVWREGKQWRMLVGSGIRGQGGTVLLYDSADLLAWNFIGPMCTGMGADCFQWECPNFFPLGDRWVLVVSPLLHSIPSLRGPVQYAVGTYDGRRFEPGPWHPLDLGGPTVFYAPNSLENDQGHRILWGWIMGGGHPDIPWNGLLTLPRRLELGSDRNLRVWPVPNVETLRTRSLADVTDRELKHGESLDLCRGAQLDIVVDLARRSSGRLTLDLFRPATGDPATTLRIDLATGQLQCGDRVGTLPRDGDLCTLRVLVDRSVIEVYADRREVMSLRAYPPPQADGVRLTAELNTLHLARIRAWQMDSIW